MKLSLATHWDVPTTLQAARTWDRPGIDGIWLDETLWYNAPLTMASACAAVTESLRIGIGIVTVGTSHPSYWAMHYGTFAELAGGRAILGLGSGVEGSLRRIGVETRLPRTAVKETIEIMRSVLSGAPTTYEGKRFSARDVQLGFDPGVPTPLFWGAMGDRSIDTCGEVADGWIISIMEPAAYVDRGVQRLRTAAGGRDVEVVQFQMFACDDDSRVGRDRAKELIAEIVRDEFEYFVGTEEYVGMFAADLEGISEADYLGLMRRLADGGEPAKVLPDELVAQVAIAGDPAECAAQIKVFADLGVTEIALKPAGDDLERIAVAVAEQIAPELAALSS